MTAAAPDTHTPCSKIGSRGKQIPGNLFSLRVRMPFTRRPQQTSFYISLATIVLGPMVTPFTKGGGLIKEVLNKTHVLLERKSGGR